MRDMKESECGKGYSGEDEHKVDNHQDATKCGKKRRNQPKEGGASSIENN